MTKVFKILSKTLLVIAVALFAASFIIPGLSDNQSDQTYLLLIVANACILVFAVTGAILIESGNDTVRRIGHGLTVSSFLLGLTFAIPNLSSQVTIDSTIYNVKSTAAIIMIVANAILVLSYLFRLIILILNKNGVAEADSPSEDSRVLRIREWKQILDEGIITEEEFEEKRCKILGLTKTNKPANKNN